MIQIHRRTFSLLLLASILVVGVTADVKPALKTTTDTITVPGAIVEFALVKLPPGKISLKDKDGREKQFEIKPIWIGRNEVTWNEYDTFWMVLDLPERERARSRAHLIVGGSRPAVPYAPPDRGWGHDGFPAGSMHCRWAKAYCEWLSSKTGRKYRLPTEAEWEYACRAGGPPVTPDKAQLDKIAWYAGNSEQQRHKVASKEPNAWGLYDMLGNVAEWVTRDDKSEVVAGGSFLDDAADVHSGARAAKNDSWERDDPQVPKDTSWFWNGGHVGFRVVRED
jgi:formylglycine-generating enzyme required for sulfatase activity